MEFIGIVLTLCAITLYNVGCVWGYALFGVLALIIFFVGGRK